MTASKADFTDIYTQPDPRAYYETLGSLDYEIPTHGCRVFQPVIEQLREETESPTVLDICSSYGVNAALVNHDITMSELTAHYRDAGDLSPFEMIERDRSFFAERRRPDAVDIVGLDVSQAAIGYAVAAGLLTEGIVADLESRDLDRADAERIASVDLVTVTGGVGYVNERTFEQILDAAEEPPWVAALSLRWVDFDPIAETLLDHGLVAERFEGYVVPQRRFADEEEERFVLRELEGLGAEPTAVERSGRHGAELYVARPAEAVGVSLPDLLGEAVDYAVMPPSTTNSLPVQ